MEIIKSWLISVVISCFISTIILFFSPTSSVGKSVRTVVTLFIMSTFLTPIVNGTIADSFNSDDYVIESETDKIVEEINSQMQKTVSYEVKHRISEILSANQINFYDIEVTTDIDENNCIVIKEIVLTVDSKHMDEEEMINKKIREIYKIDGEFIWD